MMTSPYQNMNTRMEEKAPFTISALLILLYFSHKLLPTVGQIMPGIVYAGLFLVVALMIAPVWTTGHTLSQLFPLLSITIVTIIGKYIFNANILGIPLYLYGELQTFLYALIAAYYLRFCNRRQRKHLLTLILLMYVVTAVTTSMGCAANPNAARYLATVDDTNSSLYQQYTRAGIGGFAFIYESVLITPVFIYLLKSRRINKIVGVASIVAIGFGVFASEYTTALLFYLSSLILLFFRRLQKRHIVIIFVIALFLATIGKSIIVLLLENLIPITGNNVAVRLEYIVSQLTGAEIDSEFQSGYRTALYMSSIRAFFSTYMIGNWNIFSYGSGGHSYILDNMANYGIVGLIAIIGQYKCIYRQYILPTRETDCYYYFVFIMLMGVALALVNTNPSFFIHTVVLCLLGNLVRESDYQ